MQDSFGDPGGIVATLYQRGDGLLRNAELLVEGESLLFRARRAWLFGIPLPLWLSPRIEAENHPATSDGWQVRVCFRVPLLGEVARYEGTVTPVDDMARHSGTSS